MRFLNAEFIGYIGFKNGMGLDRVYIDFTKGKNNIVLISGMNGSGKSTLLTHLNIFPDPSSSFTPGIDASKAFTILDNDIVYTIQLLSGADNNGGRKTTKAFIQKNGQELNTNGNVSSYKDIVYSEFELDTNYMTLSHLSNDGNKGLGSLTPAERKKFTANIMENLDVYNEMYKTLSKKSSIYKSYIANLHAKIQNIGSKDYIESNLKQLREKEHSISVRIMELNNTIVSIQAKCTVDEDEAQKVEKLNTQMSVLKDKLDTYSSNVSTWFNKLKISPDDIDEKYDQDYILLHEYKTNLEVSKADWINKSKQLEDLINNIRSVEAEMEMYSGDNNIINQYNTSKQKISELESELDTYGIKPNTDLILPLNNLLKVFKDLITLIDNFYSDATSEDLEYLCLHYNPSDTTMYQEELQNTFDRISSLETTISETRDKLTKISVLENRPKDCKNDNCPFVKEAIKINKEFGKSIEEDFVKLQRSMQEESRKITNLNKLIEISRFRDSKSSILGIITSTLDSNMELFKLLGISVLENRELFLKQLSQQNAFNDIRDPQAYINILNALISYDSEYKSFEKISIQYDNHKDKMKLFESNQKILNRLNDQSISLQNEVNSAKTSYDTYNDLVTSFSRKVNDELLYKEENDKKKDIESAIRDIQTQLDEYAAKAGKSVALLSQIKQYRDEIDKLTIDTKPISDEISKLTGQLTMLESYYTEYEQYKTQFDMIETLKKYCSPTSGGIQVLFMQLYMSKTLELSNQILSMLFSGDYRLLDFIINQNEFRIPFVGNGLPVDDISSGSSSQVCMMSMIINLVLLHQASTKFNIARLDEIDDSLDTYNRSNFVNVLYKILPLLNIEQLFIISHSIELDSSFADVIKLKSYDDYDGIISNNIIWDYKKEIQYEK